jgi:heterotetrameric sarcosine oxidase gamma subunit
MNAREFSIIRLSPKTVSLLQYHSDTEEVIKPLMDSLLDAKKGRAAATGARAYSIGPTEWLLVDYSLEDMRRRLHENCGRCLARITDLSAGFAILRVTGTATRRILASDISAPGVVDSAQPGDYARTRIARIEVILQCIGLDAFDLHLDRSLSEYLEKWLENQFMLQGLENAASLQ